MSLPQPTKELHRGQIKFCEFLANPQHVGMTRAKMAKEIGVAPNTLNTWSKLDSVIAYRNKLVTHYAGDELSAVWKALITKAKAGNVPAIKLYFEMMKMYVPPAQVIEMQNKVEMSNINIIANIPRPQLESREIIVEEVGENGEG